MNAMFLRTIFACLPLAVGACSGSPAAQPSGDDQDLSSGSGLSSGFGFSRRLDLMNSEAEVEPEGAGATARGQMDPSKYAAAIFEGKAATRVRFAADVSVQSDLRSFPSTTYLFGWKGPDRCLGRPATDVGVCSVNDGKNWGVLSGVEDDGSSLRDFVLRRDGRYMVLVTSTPQAYDGNGIYRLFVQTGDLDPGTVTKATATASGQVVCSNDRPLPAGLMAGIENEEVPVDSNGRFALRHSHVPNFYTAWVRNTNKPEVTGDGAVNPQQIEVALTSGENSVLLPIHCD